MDPQEARRCVAFAGTRCIAAGELVPVALTVKRVLDQEEPERILLFDAESSERIELDLRGTAEDVRQRLAAAGEGEPLAAPEPEPPRGPGRRKLGVVAREVTLLPRHWEWLNEQPGGASVALRKLVEEARRTHADQDRVRRRREAAYRFMVTIAGNFPGFEEASRALFAGNRERLAEQIRDWPKDVREHLLQLAPEALPVAAGCEP